MTLDEGGEDDNDDKDAFNTQLLCAYNESDIVPDSGDALVNETDKHCPSGASLHAISM